MYSRRWNALTASAVISPGMSAQAIVAKVQKGCPCVMAARIFGFRMSWSEADDTPLRRLQAFARVNKEAIYLWVRPENVANWLKRHLFCMHIQPDFEVISSF